MGKPPFRAEIFGVPVTVVSSEEDAKNATLVVCMLWNEGTRSPDDVAAACWGCGAKLRHRPYMPTRPPKLCLTCALASQPGRRH